MKQNIKKKNFLLRENSGMVGGGVFSGQGLKVLKGVVPVFVVF